MKKKEANYQCQQCGKITIEYKGSPREELYNYFWCKKCGTVTAHLWIGQNILDKYLYYNHDLDERYY